MISAKKIINLFLNSIYIILFFATLYNENMGAAFLSFIIIHISFFMFLFRKNQAFLICLFFANTYYAYMILYYFFHLSYSTYGTFITLEYSNSVLRITSLFLIISLSLIKIKGKESRMLIPSKDNCIIYYICIFIMIIITIYAYNFNSIFAFNYGVIQSNSTVYEYYLIFSLCAYCFSGNEYKKKMLLLLNCIYIIGILLLGLRLVALELLLLVFMLFFENKIKTIWVIILLFILFAFFSAWAYIRVGYTNVFDFGLYSILLGDKEGFVISNQGDIFATSVTHYGLIQEGRFDIVFRIKSLLAFLANIFLFPQYQFKEGILNQSLDGYLVGGGGFGAVYAFVWLGYMGVLLLAIYISYFINYSYKNIGSSYISIYGFFIIMTFFRWYAYSLYIVFKMGFWFLLIYMFFCLIDKKLKRKII